MLFYESLNIFLGIVVSVLSPFISVCYKKIIDYITVSSETGIVYKVILNYVIIQALLEIIENISLHIDAKKDLELNQFLLIRLIRKSVELDWNILKIQSI